MRILWSKDGAKSYRWNRASTYALTMSANESNILDSIPNGLDTIDIDPNNNLTVGIIVNFPNLVQVKALGIKAGHAQSGNVTVYASNNSSDGFDGTWTTIASTQAYPAANTYATINMDTTNFNATWLKYVDGSGTNYQLSGRLYYAFHVFGTYINPLFEFWNTAHTVKLDTLTDVFASALTLPNAYSASAYNKTASFCIKNTDLTASHTYTLSVVAVKYNGDTLITNNFTLSTNSVTVAAGQYSSDITLTVNIASIDNPADGYHYYGIQAVQS